MWLLAATATVVVALSLIRIPLFWSRARTYLDTVARVWTAAAVDLAGGVMYRPAGRARRVRRHSLLSSPPDAARDGHCRHRRPGAKRSNRRGLFGLAAGPGRLPRRPRTRWRPASGGLQCRGILASQTTQHALLSSDEALPAALNMIGIACCASGMLGVRHALLAACLFVLAFAPSRRHFGACWRLRVAGLPAALQVRRYRGVCQRAELPRRACSDAPGQPRASV